MVTRAGDYRVWAGILAWGGVVLLVMACGCAATVTTGVVPEDWPAGITAPVVVPVAADQQDDRRFMARLTVGRQTEPSLIPAQYEPADPIGGTPARVWFFFSANEADRGKDVAVSLIRSGPPEYGKADLQNGIYRSRHDDPMLHVATPDDKPILSYWHGAPAPGLRYPLNDFIHPVFGLDGETLTDRSPDDHHHHRGIFWAWVRNDRKGEPIGDWWIPKNIHVEPGTIRFADGPVFTRFVAQHFWVHQPAGADKAERFVEEQVVCRIFNTTGEGRAIDIDLTLTALDDGVRIGGQLYKDKGYGGLTVRFGKATDVRIECDRRVIAKDTLNHLRARWVDWTGVFAGPDGRPLPHRSGAALIVHPTHPDCPPEWITRRYGPINVSYPGLDMLEIPRDRPLRLRYRMWVHRGNARAGNVNEHYHAYAADWKWTSKKG